MERRSDVTRLTKAEWLEQGREKFSDDMFAWKFRCPNCKHIQSVEDFRQYKEKGATPEDAYYNCIGRFMDNAPGIVGNSKSPCDYTSGGLFCLNKVIVVDGEKETPVFEFA